MDFHIIHCKGYCKMQSNSHTHSLTRIYMYNHMLTYMHMYMYIHCCMHAINVCSTRFSRHSHPHTCAGSTLRSLSAAGASPCSLHLPWPGPPSVHAMATPSLPLTPASLPSALESSRHRNSVATGLSLYRITCLECVCVCVCV